MAYMTQENKKVLAALAKAALPAGWKATFAVRHHSTIVCTIKEAPAYVLEDYKREEDDRDDDRPYINEYHLDKRWTGETLKVLEKLRAALYTGNHDRSDIQTDYFDVGWYVSISFGHWNKPVVWNDTPRPEGEPEPEPTPEPEVKGVQPDPVIASLLDEVAEFMGYVENAHLIDQWERAAYFTVGNA